MTGPEAVIREYVCKSIADCSADRIDSVSRLPSGENNAVYTVAYRDRHGEAKAILARLGAPGEAARLRAEREAAVLRKVGGVAGPALYDFRADAAGLEGPFMCLEFIHGSQPDLADVGPEGLERLGRLVRWLHTQPVDDLEGWTPHDAGLRAYVRERWRDHVASRLGAIRDPLPASLQERLRAGAAVAAGAMKDLMDRAAARPDDRLVLLHADVSGANLMWAPEPVLIDWEYARLGDPADEVAYLFTQNALAHLQRSAFWQGYSEGLAPAEVRDLAERVRYWEPITVMGSVLWWLDAWSRAETAGAAGDPSLPKEAGYYLEQAVARLDRLRTPTAFGRVR